MHLERTGSFICTEQFAFFPFYLYVDFYSWPKMHHLTRWLFTIGVLLFDRESHVLAQSTASWIFPLIDHTTIIVIDTIFLQWTSNYEEAYLNMWCQNGSTGPNVVLGKYNKESCLPLRDTVADGGVLLQEVLSRLIQLAVMDMSCPKTTRFSQLSRWLVMENSYQLRTGTGWTIPWG